MTARKCARVHLAVALDVVDGHLVAGTNRLEEPNQGIDLPLPEGLDPIAFVHEFDADRGGIVIECMVGDLVLGSAGEREAVSIHNVVDAKERGAVEELLPTLR